MTPPEEAFQDTAWPSVLPSPFLIEMVHLREAFADVFGRGVRVIFGGLFEHERLASGVYGRGVEAAMKYGRLSQQVETRHSCRHCWTIGCLEVIDIVVAFACAYRVIIEARTVYFQARQIQLSMERPMRNTQDCLTWKSNPNFPHSSRP